MNARFLSSMLFVAIALPVALALRHSNKEAPPEPRPSDPPYTAALNPTTEVKSAQVDETRDTATPTTHAPPAFSEPSDTVLPRSETTIPTQPANANSVSPPPERPTATPIPRVSTPVVLAPAPAPALTPAVKTASVPSPTPAQPAARMVAATAIVPNGPSARVPALPLSPATAFVPFRAAPSVAPGFNSHAVPGAPASPAQSQPLALATVSAPPGAGPSAAQPLRSNVVPGAQPSPSAKAAAPTTTPPRTAPSAARVATQDNPCACPGYVPYGFTIPLGIYEVTPALVTSPQVKIEHYFVSWVGARSIWQQNLSTARSRGHTALITVEPYPAAGLTSPNLLSDIVAGSYDSYIQALCSDIAQTGVPVYVRWGHEMENVTGRYPWATANSNAYIGAYTYFVTKCRALAPKALFVWSPAGNSNLSAYWPGAQYVDWVGLSMYSYPTWELSYYGKVRSFVEAFSERYNFVNAYNKPVMIAEFGAIDTPAGSISYVAPTPRDMWLKAALAATSQFPLLQMFVFFNAQDPAGWGANYPAPDWRLAPWDLDTLPPPGVTW